MALLCTVQRGYQSADRWQRWQRARDTNGTGHWERGHFEVCASCQVFRSQAAELRTIIILGRHISTSIQWKTAWVLSKPQPLEIMEHNAIQLFGILLIYTFVRLLAAPAFEDGNNNNVKITKHSLELTQTINIQRQEFMQRQCDLLDADMQTLDDLTELQMDHMIVDKEHKLLYCYVPKVLAIKLLNLKLLRYFFFNYFVKLVFWF